MRDTVTLPGEEDAPPFARPMWITSALVVGALVLAAIVLAVTAGNDSDTSAARLLAPASPAAADGARCPELADGDPRIPTSAPADTTWGL